MSIIYAIQTLAMSVDGSRLWLTRQLLALPSLVRTQAFPTANCGKPGYEARLYSVVTVYVHHIIIVAGHSYYAYFAYLICTNLVYMRN